MPEIAGIYLPDHLNDLEIKDDIEGGVCKRERENIRTGGVGCSPPPDLNPCGIALPFETPQGAIRLRIHFSGTNMDTRLW